ncbi:hypothetical protein N7517_011594 [Penicillium concentricum]|uniref:Uncharacterized protein n=1 Tax=Penicillium concentricum TaxID=293559 RepID=A0A9W9RCE3_9EURO|nr:uncharacterized protein N7517_011594 [Penicillium concentricum]KAJ5356985.1 hypothetical protein N7517_011594 [Penicillium concentricum]
MPTTRRQKQEKGEEILHGLIEGKRVRKSKATGSSTASKSALDKGKKKEKGKESDPISPHVALATKLLERGANFNFPEPSSQGRPGRRVWGPREVPITDQSQLPDGWSVDEPDLDEFDVDGQIERCKERISEGILPQFFQNRMISFTAIKQERMDMINSEPEGLSWEIVQRLDCLKKLQRSFEARDDDDNLSNVKAIMTAYRSGKLIWDRDSVSYWSKDKLIAGPKKLDMQEFYSLSAKHGPKGFWVEGIWISLRNPTTQATNTMATTMTFDFLEDTGASSMRIFSEDRNRIENLSGAPVPVFGKGIKQTAGGQVEVQNVILQANIIVNGQPLLPYWVDIKTSVTPGCKGSSGDRLSGVWIHHLLFVLSMPDNTQRKHMGTNLGEMTVNLPLPDYRNARPPAFI